MKIYKRTLQEIRDQWKAQLNETADLWGDNAETVMCGGTVEDSADWAYHESARILEYLETILPAEVELHYGQRVESLDELDCFIYEYNKGIWE